MHRTSRQSVALYGLMVALAAPCPGANSNSAYGGLSTNYVTPHIAWGKPLAGDPIRALVVAPMWTHRETVELAQRLSLEPIPVMVAHYHQMFPLQERLYFGPSREEMWKAVERQLTQAVDVIVIGKVHWNGLNQATRELLLAKIEKGAGLVYVNPPPLDVRDWADRLEQDLVQKDARDDRAFDPVEVPEQEKLEKQAEAELTALWKPSVLTPPNHRIPRGLAGVAAPRLDGKTWADIVRIGEYGRGRIARIDYPNQAVAPSNRVAAALILHSLTPSFPAKEPAVFYEYYQSLLARVIVWAARRETNLAIARMDVPAAVSREALAAGRIRLAASGRAETGKSLAWRVEIRDDGGDVGQVVWTRTEALAAGMTNELPLPPTLLPGQYFVEAWLLEEERVADWASRMARVTPGPGEGKRMAAIAVEGDACRAHGLLRGAIDLKEPLPPGEHIRLGAWDFYGRCVWATNLVPAGDGRDLPFSGTLPLARSLSVRLTAERIQAGPVVAELKERTIPVQGARTDDDFHFLIWSNPGGSVDARPIAQALRAYRDYGIDADYNPTWDPNPEADLAANLRVAPIIWRITGEQDKDLASLPHREELRQHCRAAALKCQAYDPLLFSLGDETWAFGTFPASPDNLKAYRKYLATVYRSVDDLNRAWNTTFETFDKIAEFVPLELDRKALPAMSGDLGAVGQNGKDTEALLGMLEAEEAPPPRANPGARWVDQNLYLDWLCADFRRWCVQVIKEVTPNAFVGDEGSGSLASGHGRDWEKVLAVCDIAQNYDNLMLQLDRSFARPNSIRGFWLGNYPYYRMDEDYMRSAPWVSLFQGLNSIWWWKGYPGEGSSGCNTLSALKPDLTPIPAFQQVADSVRDLRRGMATLLLKVAQPLPEPIAVLYSPPSLHTATMLGMKTAVNDSTAAAVYGFARPYRYRFVSDSQVEKGILMEKPYRALILPAAYALSDAQARAIERFVRQGGLAVADIVPGLYTEHGAARTQSALEGVFGGASAWEPRAVGQGQALLLARAFADCGGTNRDAEVRLAAAQRRLFGAHEEGLQPVGAVKGGTRIPVWAFTNGAAWYAGLDLNWAPAMAKGPEPVTLTFPAPGYIYDVRAGKLLGQSNSVTVALTWRPAVYASLPYAVEGVTLEGLSSHYGQGDRIRFEAAVQRPAGRTESHVLNVALLGPDGRELEFGRRNVITKDGRAPVDIPLALNELAGEYRIRVTDVASGQSVERGLSVP